MYSLACLPAFWKLFITTLLSIPLVTFEVNESFVFNKKLSAEFSISFLQGVQLEKHSSQHFTLGKLQEKDLNELESVPG